MIDDHGWLVVAHLASALITNNQKLFGHDNCRSDDDDDDELMMGIWLVIPTAKDTLQLARDSAC
jgi:hypothetical protein